MQMKQPAVSSRREKPLRRRLEPLRRRWKRFAVGLWLWRRGAGQSAGGVRVLAAHIGTRAALWPAPLLHSHGPTAKGLGDGEGVLPDGEGVFGGARNRRLLHLHAIDSAAITNESNSGVSS